MRANVSRVLLGAFDDDPVEAARKAHWAAGYVIRRDRAAQLRLEVLDRCRRAASLEG
ncbi:hypothetical protein LCL61_29585 [Amycolatopsis coloradensis]|uniref:Uncharacterized protein n=1 Tax=Amycolatopsis coloradensis TaxID=76021 RepID=A0ACD5BKA1_9PSEU